MSEPNMLVARRYRIRMPIGHGGMGRVWLAEDELLRRDVAIKEIMLPPGERKADAERLFHRVLIEAQAVARVHHHNVVHIYDLVEYHGKPWLVMEYVPSRTLYEMIAVEGALPPAYVATIGVAMLDALTAAHAAGVLHRDVTPRNTLIARDGRVVLSDFGLATWDECDDGADHEVRGTAAYVAPERVETGESSPEGDYWSLGATLYAAVEGHSPYARETVEETITALLSREPDPPLHAGDLEPVLLGLLIRDPHLRLPPWQARRMLQAVASGEQPDPASATRPWRDWTGAARLARPEAAAGPYLDAHGHVWPAMDDVWPGADNAMTLPECA